MLEIMNMLNSALACADEKVSVSSSTADIATKLRLRIDHAFNLLETGEISERLRFGDPNHPALRSQAAMGLTRSQSRREVLALRRAAAGGPATQEDAEILAMVRSGKSSSSIGGTKHTNHVNHLQNFPYQSANSSSSSRKRPNNVLSANSASHAGARGRMDNGRVKSRGNANSNSGPYDDEPKIRKPHPNQYTYMKRDSGGNLDRGHNSNNYNANGDVPRRVSTSSNGHTYVDYRQPHSSTSHQPQQRHPTQEQIQMVSQDKSSKDEPRYCYCNGVSYGEMVACDNEKCPREW